MFFCTHCYQFGHLEKFGRQKNQQQANFLEEDGNVFFCHPVYIEEVTHSFLTVVVVTI